MKNTGIIRAGVVLSLAAVFLLGSMLPNAGAATGANELTANKYSSRVGDWITLTDRITLTGDDLPNRVTVRVTFYGKGRFNMWQEMGYRDVLVYVQQGRGGPARGSSPASVEFPMPRWTLGRAYFYTKARVIKYEGIRLPKSLVMRDSNPIQVAVS